MPNTAALEDNRRLAWSEYSRGALEVSSRPFKVSVEITRNCNYRCVMCPQSWDARYQDYHPEYNMTPALFARVAEQLFPSMEYVHLQGYGESVISPYWPEILELCRPYAQGRRFGLVTNLSRKGDELWRRMMGMGFVVIVSYDGATKETFEKIRRGGNFDHVQHNLGVVAEELRAGSTGKLAFLVTLQKYNFHEMPLFIDQAARFGAGTVTFASVIDGPSRLADAAFNGLKRLRRKPSIPDFPSLWELVRGRARLWMKYGNPRLALYDVEEAALAALKKETLARAAKAGIAVRFNDAFLAGLGRPASAPEPLAPPPELSALEAGEGIALSGQVARFQSCFKPYSYVVVNYRGDVGLCNHLITDQGWKQMGNLGETSFEDIWNSPAYREARRALTTARPDNPSCAWCFKHRMTD